LVESCVRCVHSCYHSDEAAATAEANAVKLRDLFRSFNDLEVINHDTRSKIQSLNEALSEQVSFAEFQLK
jgi:hypothetical protein